MESEKILQHQQAAKDNISAMQAAFLANYKNTFGDELEEEIRDFLSKDSPRWDQYLREYDYPEVIRLNALELTLTPIVQLAEMKGLGAAVIFAERITSYTSKGGNYVDLFYNQISKIKIATNNNKNNHPEQLNIQIAIAKLVSIFTYNYSLYSLHSNKISRDLIDIQRQKELRKGISEYVVAVTNEVIVFLNEFANTRKINLDQLKAEFLLEESKAKPDRRWKRAMNFRDQTVRDAQLASKYARETFNVIESEISACSIEKIINTEKLYSWVAKGINFITCLNNIPVFYEMDLPNYNFRSPHLLDGRLSQQLNRYISLRNALKLSVSLFHAGLLVTFEELSQLDFDNQEALSTLISMSTSKYFKSNNIVFSQWNLAMVANSAKLLKLIEIWPDFNDYESLSKYSYADLNQYLDILLCNSSHFNTIQSKSAFVKKLFLKLPNLELIQFIINLPTPFFSFIGKNFDIKMIEFLFNLSSDARKKLFSLPPTINLLSSIKEWAASYNPDKQDLFQLIFNSHYLLSKLHLKDQPEIAFILSRALPVSELTSIFCSPDGTVTDHTKMVFSHKGIQCHTKNYCSFSSQYELDPKKLIFLQEIMLKKQAPLTLKWLNLLSSPGIILAYEAKFLDVAYIASCTLEELREIVPFWQEAKKRGILNTWDPQFSNFIQEKRNLFQKKAPKNRFFDKSIISEIEQNAAVEIGVRPPLIYKRL